MKKILVFLALLGLLMPSCGVKKRESWLFVLHARRAEISETDLRLGDLDHYVLAFTDRPERKTKMIPYEKFIKNWPEAFNKVNPNASISHYTRDGEFHSIAAELINPKIEGNTVLFEIKQLDGAKIEGRESLGETALFIDGAEFLRFGK